MTSVQPAAQTAGAVLMVRPQSFGWNPETGASNRFQVDTGAAPLAVSAAASREFAALSSALAAAGVEVHVIEDRALPRCPDAVFPNNWVSFHADGTIVLYPMLAPNRRLERRTHRLHEVVEQGGYEVTRVCSTSRITSSPAVISRAPAAWCSTMPHASRSRASRRARTARARRAL